ncbi:uncharacterized protein [Atheta coriaria]|uniref:uncharacterized protein n=1 Tax=Dalotia coriaria TaxID=877792 RepID=UPI0031F38524
MAIAKITCEHVTLTCRRCIEEDCIPCALESDELVLFCGRTQCRNTTVFSPSCSRLILWFLLFSGRSHCRGATVLSPNSLSKRTQCRKTTVFSPNSGDRIVVGQLFFHQIPANAMSWGNRSCAKLYGALNGSHFYRYFRTVP